MMFCVDGAEIDSLTLALVEREGDELHVVFQETFSRRLGNELAVVEEFLTGEQVSLRAFAEFGLVCGPGSAGALRSTLSLINACALVLEKEVIAVQRTGEVWHLDGLAKPYVLPVYDRPVHTTPSFKDALGRRV